ncbi:hypothetical protein E4U43_002338 [Claviceps pusilla]|uniref:Uncharacterized protein n=1 Tax=Claviceps pusilla TaxID=123648 RepID=A0A9P7N906_9HYPO|nr:hypothetical protein E4U43_002338 [Claviceps pusilla]
MPTGAASSTKFSETKSVNAVHDVLGHQTPRKFLAKRTPRPKPQFVSAPLSNQTRLRTSHAPGPNESASAQPSRHAPPSFRRGMPSQHHQPVSPVLAQSDADQSKGIQESRPLASPKPPLSVQRRPDSSCSDDPSKQPDSKAHMRHDSKCSTPTALVINLTQGDELAHVDAWALTAVPRIVASKQINVSAFGGASTRSPLSKPVYLEDTFVVRTEARPIALTSDHKSTEARIGHGAFRKSSQPNAEATEAWTDKSLGKAKRRRERGNSTARSGVAGEVTDKSQKKIVSIDPHGNVVQGGVSKPGEINTYGVRKRFNRSASVTGLSKRLRESGHGAEHDHLDLDAAIYGQPGAAPPPPEVNLCIQSPCNMESQNEQRRFIHANPAIHLMHNRSDTWHARKASEIESRGGRKFWFGNVAGRLRWSRANREELLPPREGDSEEGTNGNGINEGVPQPRRRDAKSNVQPRALDFGDIPEEELPDYVQQNPAWLKACEFFRQTKERREARMRASKVCEQETQDFFDKVIHVHSYDL